MTRGRTKALLTTWVDADGSTSRSPDEVAVEEPLEIRLDGHLVGTVMRTPGHDFELAVGFCHTEGLLGDAAVRGAKYCRDAGPGAVVESDFNVVTVSTGGRAPIPEPRLSVTSSACGMCGTTAVDELRTRLHPLPVTEPLPVEAVLGAPGALLGATPIFESTGAVHAAALFGPDGEAIVVREDVGRHNAVDKVVGHELLAGNLPRHGHGLAVSGRVGFEIVQKAWAAGIGTVVAKGAPTSLAVDAARIGRITLLGWADERGARAYGDTFPGMTRLGYQIPSFTYPDGSGGTLGPADIFDVVVRQAKEADESGFDTVMVMDHFFQLPMLGQPDDYMLECYTVLAALAQHTSRARLSALVTGNTYRNPAMLAKIIASLDVVSGGRAQLGIGAGWFELEHDAFGIPFGTFTDRFEKLEEALQIIIPMLRGERPTFEGDHYAVTDAICEPPPIGRVPLMIGGSGEKKTLRMVAQYADDSNMTAAPEEIPRKLDALAAHCERLGRDRSEITVTLQRNACIAPTHEEAQAELDAALGARGLDLSSMAPEEAEAFRAIIDYGTPDEIGERFSEHLALGIDGFTVNSIANGHIPGRVALLGETLSKVVG